MNTSRTTDTAAAGLPYRPGARDPNALLLAIAHAAAALGAAEDWLAALPALLAEAAREIGVQRILLFRVQERSGETVAQTCLADWAVPGLEAISGDPRFIGENLGGRDGNLAEWIESHRHGGFIRGCRSEAGGALRAGLERLGIHSFMSVPVMVDDAWWGHLAVCDCVAERPWSDLERAVLAAAAALIAGAIKREAVRRRLVAQEAAGQALMHHALDAIVTADSNGHVEEFNPAASRIFGLTQEQVIGRPFAEMLIPDHLRAAHHAGFDRLRTGGPQRILGERVETEARRADGRVFPVELTVIQVPGGDDRRFAAHIRDISDRRRAEAALEQLAFGDATTGRLNRPGLVRALAGMARPVLVAAVDIAALADAKTTFGGAFSDRVMLRLADRLDMLGGDGHLLARIGDFSFALVETVTPEVLAQAGLAQAGQAQAGRGDNGPLQQILLGLQELLARPFTVESRILHLEPRCGVALGRSESGEEVLRDAELAAGLATQFSGPVAYSPDMRAERVKRLELESALRAGLETEGQFVIHYQPIVALDGDRVAGFEALLRWQHPGLGMVPPLDFIPLAEATGLIIPLGRHVLELACRTAASWTASAAARVDIAVNISPIQLSDPGLVDAVGTALAMSGLAPGRLKLEITESGIIEASGSAVATLHRLRDMGIVLALDDFGTGYSSLAMLRDLPVSILKIDRFFVMAMDRGRAGDAVLANIVALADSLRLDTVAEGIETPEEAARLRALGCTHGQGWFFGRPVPPDAALHALIAAASEV